MLILLFFDLLTLDIFLLTSISSGKKKIQFIFFSPSSCYGAVFCSNSRLDPGLGTSFTVLLLGLGPLRLRVERAVPKVSVSQ